MTESKMQERSASAVQQEREAAENEAMVQKRNETKEEALRREQESVLDETTVRSLIETAIAQLPRAYVPYSGFRVGAALLAKEGSVYTGCNIENAAYTPSNCAERTAFFKAVSEGVTQFDAICVVGGQNGVLTELTPPCGVCRQVMMEFCSPEQFQIILATDTEHYRIYKLKEILPMGFGPGNLA